MKPLLVKIMKIAAIVLFAGFILIQLVPLGRNHTNPPVVQEPNWNSAETRALAVNACFDCHSNKTVWPWYSHVAPVSWFVQYHVDNGREKLNFSEWDADFNEKLAEKALKLVKEGKMPLRTYLPAHPEARLNSAQTQQLLEGFQATALQSEN